MKTPLLTFLIALTGLCLAQPTITSASNPQIGQSWDAALLDAPMFDPGPAGANQNWDFSSIQPDPSFPLFTFDILDPNDGPLNDSFPTATHIVFWNLVGFNFYQYEYSDNNIRAALGGIVPDGDTIQSLSRYLDDDDAVQYPLNYQKQYSFTSREETKVFGFTFTNDIEGQVDMDAYGTLTTHRGTYNNVMRMRIQRITIDSLFFPPSRDTSYQYAWFEEGNAMPLLVYEFSLDPTEPTSLYSASPRTNTGINPRSSLSPLELFPNPAHNQLTLRDEHAVTGKEIEIALRDLQGRQVQVMYKGDAGILKEGVKVSVEKLSPGMYWIQMNSKTAAQFIKL